MLWQKHSSAVVWECLLPAGFRGPENQTQSEVQDTAAGRGLQVCWEDHTCKTTGQGFNFSVRGGVRKSERQQDSFEEDPVSRCGSVAPGNRSLRCVLRPQLLEVGLILKTPQAGPLECERVKMES